MDGWEDRQTDGRMDGCVAQILLVFTQFHNATKEPESSGGDFTRIFSPFLGKQSLRVAAVLLPPKRGGAEKGTPSTPGGRGGGLVCEVPVPAWVPAASLVSGNPARL